MSELHHFPRSSSGGLLFSPVSIDQRLYPELRPKRDRASELLTQAPSGIISLSGYTIANLLCCFAHVRVDYRVSCIG